MNLGVLLLNGAAFVIGLGTLLLVGTAYPRLPDRVPIHFGFTGEPDAWGARPWIWLLPICGLVSFALFFGLSIGVGKDQLLLSLMNFEMLALFGVLTRDQVEVALGSRTRFGPGVWILIVTLMLTGIAVPLLMK